ncbi:MAG: hypothetical protein CMM93_00660 [Rickettsiales bacterium]|nr:hypothetical protein [Rickettsiales bacterium]|tara:strand:- start:1915 stop:2847 length:933 start_codon:yes stop_codon:yes gene_type:complete
MDPQFLIAWAGFFIATYSVMANDAPAQVLGTLIASHPNKKWILWLGASIILLAALIFSWTNYNGDISFGRLERIPPVDNLTWVYLIPPLGLLVLTRFGAPVSTSFIMLSMFTASVVLEKIMLKSMFGYFLALVIGLLVWVVLVRVPWKGGPANMKLWRPLQYISTGTLWWFWLSHDIANVAVFLPRQLNEIEFAVICVTMVLSLGLIFRSSGGAVHKFIFRDEGNDMDIRIATLIDALYALMLFVFKEWNNLPMSTTWVFVGLMAGREIGRAVGRQRLRPALQIVATRFAVLVIGAVVSFGLVMVVLATK